MKTRTMMAFFLAAIMTMITLTEQAGAIPAFARRYKISCSTCHAPFPKLKPYGADFAGAGFILKEEEKKRDYVTGGDDLLWLNKDFPIGLRFDSFGVMEPDNKVKSDIQTPYGLKLFSGGAIFTNIGYYFYFYLAERGEVAGIEDAYMHFDNVFNTNLDIMVGQFQTSDPLMKRELRLTYEDYKFYKTRVGVSNTDLAYDRGVMLIYSVDKTGTDITGFLVNGNGKGQAGEDRKFDQDKFKNFGLRLNQSIGEVGSIGFYYYSGEEASLTWGDQFTNKLAYYGPDFNLTVGPLELTTQYLIREDSNPLFNDKTTDIKTSGVIAELIFSPKLDRSRWFITALYNKINSDIDDYEQDLEDFGAEKLAYHSATLSGTYLVSRNLRLVAEYMRDIEHESNRLALGIVSAF